jgi:hypothetical protein
MTLYVIGSFSPAQPPGIGLTKDKVYCGIGWNTLSQYRRTTNYPECTVYTRG